MRNLLKKSTICFWLKKLLSYNGNTKMLSGYREDYYYFTGQSSIVGRQLSFAGIAIIWMFKTQDARIPDEMILPLILFITSITFDFLHYIIDSAIWGVYIRYIELTDAKVNPPFYYNIPPLFCFWIKHVAVLIAYVCLVEVIIKKCF